MSRAENIHHHNRMKEKIKRFNKANWSNNFSEEASSRRIGMSTHTPAICSCPMCGNPRKWFGEITRKEEIHLLVLKDGLKEIA